MTMAESTSDLEAPLLVPRPPHERHGEALQTRKSGQGLRRSKSKRLRDELTSSGPIRLPSGRWQFQYQKFVEGDAFAHDEGSTRAKQDYNRKQRETLAGFREVDDINRRLQSNSPESASTGSDKNAHAELAINLSNGMNVLLLVLKIVAWMKSGSLAILASTLDSLLDLLAGFVLFFAHYYMQQKNRDKYPIGKLRIQPLGIVIFAATMATLGVQVLMAGVEQLLEGSFQPLNNGQRIWLIAVMGSATFVKLGLFLYCRTFDNDIVNAYATDHFFDVVTNVVGLAAALLADRFYGWIDPTGAIFLALYTIFNWGKTVLENAESLVGKAAPTHVLQKLTYMAVNHHHLIQQIDTVRAYTFGSFYFVEVDIQLPEDMCLKDAHEIGESLQNKLECLPEVERAFVHLDYECDHRPEHSASESKF